QLVLQFGPFAVRQALVDIGFQQVQQAIFIHATPPRRRAVVGCIAEGTSAPAPGQRAPRRSSRPTGSRSPGPPIPLRNSAFPGFAGREGQVPANTSPALPGAAPTFHHPRPRSPSRLPTPPVRGDGARLFAGGSVPAP